MVMFEGTKVDHLVCCLELHFEVVYPIFRCLCSVLFADHQDGQQTWLLDLFHSLLIPSHGHIG